MKRCPQCEFIYEDEQNTCDMDGTILAFDASVAAANAPSRSRLRSFALPAVIGTMLASLLIVAFYASPLMFASPDQRSPQPKRKYLPRVIPLRNLLPPTCKDHPSSLPSPEIVSDEGVKPVVTATDEHNLLKRTTQTYAVLTAD